MGKKLIITEKPSVARDFARVLGVSGRGNGLIENKEYVVSWCVGHLVGLVYPEDYDARYKTWRLEDLPFLPKDYKYDVLEPSKNQYVIVNRLLHRDDIDTVYWAGDSGKEGQVIEENIRNFGGVRPGMQELRVWIDSQTDEEILRGIREAKPMSDYALLGRSGIMRTIEDYALGINFSRALSVKYGNLLNRAAATHSYTAIAVGRVMTCVLGMVVDREREIRSFTETPFYRVVGSFTKAGVQAEWRAVEGSEYFGSPKLYKENGFKTEEDARNLIGRLDQKPGTIEQIEKSNSRKKAPLLYNLAELQADCSRRFKISPEQALACAQTLYEKKMTTYPRTDARVLTTAVAREIEKNIRPLTNYSPVKVYVDAILKNGMHKNIAKSQYTDDSKVTDHYAIIPTGNMQAYSSLTSLEKAVYDMIVRRFLSIFCPPAEYQNVKMTVAVTDEISTERFYASARVLVKKGYLAVAEPPKKEKEKDEEGRCEQGSGAENDGEGNADTEQETADPKVLLELADTLKKGDSAVCNGYQIREGKTSPPKRYTSGSMILAMENAGQLIEDEDLRAQIKGSGIGTSATRAEIIAKLVRIKYLNLNQKTQVLTPENLGEMVYEAVRMTVPGLLNPKMTASWEKGLEDITRGTVEFADYRSKLEDYIRRETLKMVGTDITDPLTTAVSALAAKNASGFRKSIGVKCPWCGEGDVITTPFGYGCSRYEKDKSGCNFTIGQIAGLALPENEVLKLLTEGRTDTIRGFKSKKGKRFSACLKLEKDEAGKPRVTFDFDNVEDEVLPDTVKCPNCGGKVRKTAFGYGCVNYNKEDPNSCRFSIGQIAGKKLSAANVRQLLTEGKTDTIRGFKSKTGKQFDGCLVLKRDEKGQAVIGFDFDNVKPAELKDVVCPLCGGKVLVTRFGYACENHPAQRIRGQQEAKGQQEAEEQQEAAEKNCVFTIGSIASVKLKPAQVTALLKEKKLDPIDEFVAKTGMKFTAGLKLTDEGRVEFVFPGREAPKETDIACPKCGKMLKKDNRFYSCECGYKLWHNIAGVDLPDDVIRELFATGQTAERVSGFRAKSGNTFDSYLRYQDDKIVFEFDRKPSGQEKKDSSGGENLSEDKI